jgi:hypothetical protein
MSNSKNTSGNGSMILLALIGVGAAVLFTSKSQAQATSIDNLPPATGGETDIPDAPKIVAINTTDSESPIPTAIVSDDEGMVPPKHTPAYTPPPRGGIVVPRPAQLPAAPQDDSNGSEDSGDYARPPSPTKVSPIVATRLTPAEKEIIEKGELSEDLALERPDLFKYMYVTKNATGDKSTVTAQVAMDEAQKKVQDVAAKHLLIGANTIKNSNGKVLSKNNAEIQNLITAAQHTAGGHALMSQLKAQQDAADRKAFRKTSPKLRPDFVRAYIEQVQHKPGGATALGKSLKSVFDTLQKPGAVRPPQKSALLKKKSKPAAKKAAVKKPTAKVKVKARATNRPVGTHPGTGKKAATPVKKPAKRTIKRK